ncbi:MAG: formate dehydrogenase accessory protein FdhE [Candidatus Korobacteraceae bacterium]
MANRITWDKRIQRAEELLERNTSTAEVLAFYLRVLALQQQMSESLASPASPEPTEAASLLEQLDVDLALHWLPALLELAQKKGPAKLAEEAGRIRAAGQAQQRQQLLAFLDNEKAGSYAPSSFFARILFQTQAQSLASRQRMPADYSGAICPLCGSRSQFAVLRPEGDGGKRHLACSLCLAEWEYRRILCPVCEEVDPFKLPYYSPEDPIAVRVEACDTCKAYQKSFDLTVDGLIVPDVDEIATVALDLWATEHGYHKIQLNLLGF